MSATTLAELIKPALILTAKEGLKVRAITCDGDRVNCSSLEILGANIFVQDYRDIQHFFPHVTMRYMVRVILDPYHILKLARKLQITRN